MASAVQIDTRHVSSTTRSLSPHQKGGIQTDTSTREAGSWLQVEQLQERVTAQTQCIAHLKARILVWTASTLLSIILKELMGVGRGEGWGTGYITSRVSRPIP